MGTQSLQHLVRTGACLYAWDTSVPASGVIDCEALDPGKNINQHGRAAIGLRAGVTGNILAQVQKGMGFTNVFFGSVAVNEFLAARIQKIMQTGTVVDAAAALTAVTVTFAGGGGPANAAAVVTAINTAVHAAVASVPGSGAGAVASLDPLSKYLMLTAPCGDGSMKVTGGTGLSLLLGNNVTTQGLGAAQGVALPVTGTVDLTVAGNLTALASKTLLLSVATLITKTTTAHDLAIYWEA